ncbi:MAG: hypothetical protein AB7F43_14165 [Bacteriovoracia bacterium]
MMNIISGFFKILLFTAIVLLGSQISVKDKRICDYVGDFVKVSGLETSIAWIGKNFDLANTKTGSTSSGSHSRKTRSESFDRTSLSGLLKTR